MSPLQQYGMPELINYVYDDTITIYYTVPNFMYFMSFMYFYENCYHCTIVLWPFPHPLGLHPEMDKWKNKYGDDDDDDDEIDRQYTTYKWGNWCFYFCVL